MSSERNRYVCRLDCHFWQSFQLLNSTRQGVCNGVVVSIGNSTQAASRPLRRWETETFYDIDGDEIVLLLIDTAIVTKHFSRSPFSSALDIFHRLHFPWVHFSIWSSSTTVAIVTDKSLNGKKWSEREKSRNDAKLLIEDFLSLAHVIRYVLGAVCPLTVWSWLLALLPVHNFRATILRRKHLWRTSTLIDHRHLFFGSPVLLSFFFLRLFTTGTRSFGKMRKIISFSANAKMTLAHARCLFNEFYSLSIQLKSSDSFLHSFRTFCELNMHSMIMMFLQRNVPSPHLLLSMFTYVHRSLVHKNENCWH